MSASGRAWTFEDGTFRDGAQVSALDRGFRFGMSVFETLAIWKGQALFEKEHLQRLRHACDAAGFAFPESLAVKNLLPLPNGTLRFYVTAGEGRFLEPVSRPRTYAIFDETVFPGMDEIERGARVVLSRAPMPSVLGGHKTGNYWPHVQALGEARRENHDEALVLNAQGALVSAAMANVFLVSRGVVRTPAREMGARDGVVRDWVCRQLPVEETLLSVDDVENADECFLTNSRLGVMPVVEISGRRLPGRSMANHLASLYREKVLA